jgi:hypothetical protein
VAIRRLYMPEVIIQLMVALVEGQQIAVRTAGGMTGEFKVEAFNAKYQGQQIDMRAFCDLYMAPAQFVLSGGGSSPLASAPTWSYGIAFTWPFLDMPPFFCSRRVRSDGLEGRTYPGFQEISSFALRKWSRGSVVNGSRFEVVNLDLCRVLWRYAPRVKSLVGRSRRIGAEQVTRLLYHTYRD